jgi:uncharacterized membrane protein YbaN (DUF454 family)
MKRIIFFICAWIALITGVIGIVVPVLPTTPLLLLATFLFANSSQRFHNWMTRTKVYARYVRPFKEDGRIDLATKVRILAFSFIIMGISAVVVGITVEALWVRILVWAVLLAVVVWLLYLMCIHIPTRPREAGDGASKLAKQPAPATPAAPAQPQPQED